MLKMDPDNQIARVFVGVLMTSSAMLLGACNEKPNQTVGQKVDSAIANTQQAAADAKVKTEALAHDAKANIDASLKKAEPVVKENVAETKQALKGAGAVVAGALDDSAITAAVSAGLARDADLSAVKINVNTKAGAVTLNGPAPTATAKVRAGEIARTVRGVVSVDNRLEVRG